MLHVKCKGELLSFSSHCSIFVLIDKSYEKTKILLNIFFHFHLACLALQTENIVQKITQPIFVFGNLVIFGKNGKWDENLNMYKEFYITKKNALLYFCSLSVE